MTHLEMIEVLYRIRPGAAWSLDGEGYDALTWMDDAQPQPTEQEVEEGATLVAWDAVRRERDRLLAACDWTQVADAPVDAAAWAAYRQALRDVPQDYATPDAVVWPTIPA